MADDDKKKLDDDKPKTTYPSIPKVGRPDDVVTGANAYGLMKEPKPTEDVPAPELADVSPPAAPVPDLGKPALPQSVLGTELPPGAAIPPEKMGQAQHLAENPHAEEQFRGKQEFHDTMRNFGEQKAAIRGGIIGLDATDPQFRQKLSNLTTKEGAIRAAEAHFQQSHPWGSMDSAHPGIGGKIGHAFGVMGNIAGNALIPNVMPSIPGSQANLAAKAHGGEAEEAQGLKQGQEAATTEATQAEVPLRAAETKEHEANAENKGEPKVGTTPEAATLHDLMTGDNGQPRINPKTNKPYTYIEALGDTTGAVQATKPQREETPEQQFIDEFFRKNPKGTMADAVRGYAQASQRPERSGAGDARADKSYQLQSTRLDKVRLPIEQLQSRLTRLQDTLNQHNPQADALVAPELLTVMAGGQGSGLRMNEAEIARIVGGRSVWENLKGSIQHWSTDPASARSITPDQDKMIRALVDTVHQKLNAKQQIIDRAEEELLNSDNPHDHRQVVINARKQVDAIDAGRENEQAGGTIRARNPQGKLHEAPLGTPLPAGWKAE